MQSEESVSETDGGSPIRSSMPDETRTPITPGATRRRVRKPPHAGHHAAPAIEPTPSNVFGVLSLIFWALIVVVTIKYVVFVLRADNRGEGGILSLAAVALRTLPAGGSARAP